MWHRSCMARFVYIDETGSDGSGGKRQPYLTVVGAMVDETKVRALADGLRDVAWGHLGWVPADLEFHGNEIWHGTKHWAKKNHAERIAAYEAALALLDTCDVDIAHTSIDKARLHLKYDGAADKNAYRLALQFLIEKIDTYGGGLKVLVADEAKEQQIRAVQMVAQMQEWSGRGEVPGRQLRTIIDTLHFVSSHTSPGVQIADLTAYVVQRRRGREHHPEAQAAMDRMSAIVTEHTRTWREAWPAT